MATREKIREGIKEILTEDLIVVRCTHENPPPHKDCSEECGVSLEDQIVASNPFCSPCRSGGKKHKRCMDCWEEYIDGLVTRIQVKEHSQGVVIKVDRELPPIRLPHSGYEAYLEEAQDDMKEAGYEATIPLVEE